MKYILCYGDSNTWGTIPNAGGRCGWEVRWPGVMQTALGAAYHVTEDGLAGRTTVFEDPIEEGRCGKDGFNAALEAASPLDLLILMLGTNDTKERFLKSAWDIAWGMDLLIQYVKRAGCGRDGGMPKILVCAPVRIGDALDTTILGTVFTRRSAEVCAKLPETYREIARRNGCFFFDAGLHAAAGADCVHIPKEGHGQLGAALAEKVREILE